MRSEREREHHLEGESTSQASSTPLSIVRRYGLNLASAKRRACRRAKRRRCSRASVACERLLRMQRRAADLVRDLSRALEAHNGARAGALATELDRELADEDDSALISLRLLARSFVLYLDRRAAPAALPEPVRVREDPFAAFGPAPTARAFVLQRSAIGIDPEHVRRAIRAGTPRRDLWAVEVTIETDRGGVCETVLVSAPSETEARDAASATVEAAHLGSSIVEVNARNV